MSHVFLSYVHENIRAVNKLYGQLTAQGVRVWVDRNDIDSGRPWEDAIRGAISEGDFFIACFSKEYNRRKRTFMNEELNLAIEELRKRPKNGSWFIPVRLSGEIPEWEIGAGKTLRSLQWVELTKKNWDLGLERILQTVRPLRDHLKSSGQLIAIPLIGRISPGAPEKKRTRITNQALQQNRDSLQLSPELLNNEPTDGVFALEAGGNMFQDALINNGDILILRMQETARDGENVAVWLKRQRKTVLARFYRERKRVRLQPLNPTFRPNFFDYKDIEVQAKVILVIRQLI